MIQFTWCGPDGKAADPIAGQFRLFESEKREHPLYPFSRGGRLLAFAGTVLGYPLTPLLVANPFSAVRASLRR
jgi:hypothetical protein